MRISEKDHKTLAAALELDEQGHGIYPVGAGQSANFRSLAKRGLMEFREFGLAIDRAPDREFPIYCLTEHGRALALALENQTDPELDAAAVTNEISQEIIGEMSMALAIGCEEGLIPCVEPCKGHLGPKATAVYREAYAIWARAEKELALLRAVEAHIIRLREPVSNKGELYARDWNALVAFRERNQQEEEG